MGRGRADRLVVAVSVFVFVDVRECRFGVVVSMVVIVARDRAVEVLQLHLGEVGEQRCPRSCVGEVGDIGGIVEPAGV